MSSPLHKPLPHESALRHVSGDARYVDDLAEPAGLLHGYPVGSAVAHGRIVRRDATKALQVPGVHAVLFASDIPGHNQVGPVVPDEPLLATDTVSCVGQIVAIVFADTRDAARQAAAAVEIEIDPLPAVLSIDAGIEAGQFHGPTHTIARGDADAALTSATHRLQGDVRCGAQDHFYLETHAALALPGEDRSIRLICSTQHPSETQHLVAHVLGWSSSRVTVECPRMGGGFGGKETQAAHYACLAALGSWHTGRPTKIRLERDQDMTLSGRRHPFLGRYDVGFSDDGVIQGLSVKLYADGGWATDLSMAILDRGLFHLDNAYWLENVTLVGEVVKTNHISNTAFRGFGGPQGMLVTEALLDHIANHLGLDPLAVRRANLLGDAPRNRTPYDQEVRDFRIPRIFDELEQSASYAERLEQVAAFNAAHPFTKRGLALTPVKFGISFTASFLNQAGAYIVVYADGSVQLNHGGTEMGQGLYTKMLQVCAHALGVPLDAIRHMPTSTEKVPNTSATAASSGSDLNGEAVKNAATPLVDRLRPVAAGLLGGSCTVRADDPDGGPDGAWAWNDSGSVTFSEVTQAAYFQQVSLASAGFYRTPDIGYDRTAGRGKPFHYFAYGAGCAEVEVCGLTGEWRLVRMDILHDVGNSLSPDIDRGQVEGAFMQGLGWITMEEMLWSPEGRTLTHGPSTYKIPAIGEAPEDFRVALLDRAAQADVIYGSKAVGEPPFMHGISVWSALCRAASAFGAPVQIPVPATCEAILFACEASRTEG